ncbi:MAG: hypothetical protein JOZ07_06805 [Solirubrobacterales bacterium]|nr:hypothetical protein [Solirubrobacterales bacterium]
MDEIPLGTMVQVLADFDRFGGASLGLIAWELFVPEAAVAPAWSAAVAGGLVAEAGHDPTYDERLWRLTASGWARLHERQG